MSHLPVIVIGAGGHASVVVDALLSSDVLVLGFTDVDTRRQGNTLCGLPVLGDDQSVLARYDSRSVMLANGLGSISNKANSLRFRVQTSLEAQGWKFCTVVHPYANISQFAILEPSVQVMAGCVVQANAYIGCGTILNTRVVIEHDVRVGNWSHVAPGAVIAGNANIGMHCHIGAGSVITQGVEIGAETMVGLGAAVIDDFAGSGVLVGVPARPIGF